MIYIPREDSYLLQKCVKKLTKNKSFLDMGSGSGIQAETAMKAKAKSILASDISIKSIKLLKSKDLPCIKSDLFSNISSSCKFDLIAFNPPYLPEDRREDSQSKKSTTGGKRGDELILRFLKQAKKHLNKKGKILLITSSLTPQNKILSLIRGLNMKRKIISEKKLFMEKLQIWEISEK